MLYDAKLPNKYWGESMFASNYIQNRLSTKSKENTLFNSGYKPRIDYLRAYSSKAYAYVSKEKITKSKPRAEDGILVG